MKIIAIGDVHGRDFWKSVAHTQTFDKLVFLGHYFDSIYVDVEKQIDNFMDIVMFRIAHPGTVVMLTGNHDFHYLPVAIEADEVYSGFQYSNALQISNLLQEQLDQMQMCYQWENYLFTHAGVTQAWLDNAGYNGEGIEVFINTLFKQHPHHFFFNGTNPYGDDVTQSPIWVRPGSLMKNACQPDAVKQVVGHTTMRKLEMAKDRFFFIDTQGTSRECLIVEDGCASIGKIT